MLFGIEMVMINLSLIDFSYIDVLMSFREKFCGYGFAVVIMISSSHLSLLFPECIRKIFFPDLLKIG